MLAIVANQFDLDSETFIRDHVRTIAPGQTVVLCRTGKGTERLGVPVLSDLRGEPPAPNMVKKIGRFLRFRFHKYWDTALREADERRVRSFLKGYDVRVVLAEYGPNGALMRAACKYAGIPLFVHFHGFDATQLAREKKWRLQYRRLFRDAAGIIVPSHFLAERLRGLGCPPEKLHVSENGINLANFKPSTYKPGLVVAVSRLVPVKGPLLTIKAFAITQKAIPHATLEMVGDGALRGECEALVARLGITASVTFHGAQPSDQVAALLSQASLFVQHSVKTEDGQTEAFGITPLEAAASELAVVASRSGGFVETVVDGETGILVEEHDVEGMARAMIDLLNTPARAKEMGRAGRTRVEALFTHDRTAARLRTILGLPCHQTAPTDTVEKH